MMTIVRLGFVVLILAIAPDADACSCMESGPPCWYERPKQTITLGNRLSCAERNFALRFDSRIPVKKWMDLAEPVELDASGIFSFVVHEGLSYVVSAYYRPPDAGRVRPVPTDVGPFRVTNAPAPLEIVVTRATLPLR